MTDRQMIYLTLQYVLYFHLLAKPIYRKRGRDPDHLYETIYVTAGLPRCYRTVVDLIAMLNYLHSGHEAHRRPLGQLEFQWTHRYWSWCLGAGATLERGVRPFCREVVIPWTIDAVKLGLVQPPAFSLDSQPTV